MTTSVSNGNLGSPHCCNNPRIVWVLKHEEEGVPSKCGEATGRLVGATGELGMTASGYYDIWVNQLSWMMHTMEHR